MSNPLWDIIKIRESVNRNATLYLTEGAAIDAMLEIVQSYEPDRATSAQTQTTLQSEITRLANDLIARDVTIGNLKAASDYWESLSRSYQAQWELAEETVSDLKAQLAIATRPDADVYITVKPDSAWIMQLSQAVNIVSNKHLWAANAAGTDRLVANMPGLYSGGICVHMSEGFGVSEIWPDPTGPRNWATLQLQLDFIKRTGLPPMLNLYLPPPWMRASGTTKMTSADAYKHNGRLMTSMIPLWQEMVDDGVTRFVKALYGREIDGTTVIDPDAIIWLDPGQEWKMFYEIRRGDTIIQAQRWADGDYPGTPGDVGDMDYPPYAELTIEAARRATRRLGIPDSRVKSGASYPVLAFQAGQNADSVPSDHPLYKKLYGTARKAPLYAFDRYLLYARAHNMPVDFLTLDGGTRNRDLIALTDDFSNCVRFRDLGLHIREIATRHGYGDLELVWKELYAKPQGRGSDNKQLEAHADTPLYRGLVKVRALLDAARGGAGRVYWWGWEGEGDDPGTHTNGATLNGVDKANGGEATLVYDMLKEFAEVLPVGATVYELEFEGEGLHGVATDSHYYLLNETGEARTVCLDNVVHMVSAFDRLKVAR